MTVLRLDIIDLDTHPDARLLKACAQATKLRDDLEMAEKNSYGSLDSPAGCSLLRLVSYIAQTEALTQLGVTMKAIFAMGDRPDVISQAPCMLYASVIRDFLRMGVPA